MTDDPAIVSFSIPPRRKRVPVRVGIEEAFRRFTEEMGQWWPILTYSVSRSAASTGFSDGRLGGQIIERDAHGNEHCWGPIEGWSPPRELAVRWHAGRDECEAQQLLVRFEEAGSSETDISLVHSGWEALGAAAAHAQGSYDRGWDEVLRRYFAHVHPREGES